MLNFHCKIFLYYDEILLYCSKWELVLCRTCGSQGIHMACGQLRWANPIWDCVECTSILCKYFINLIKKFCQSHESYNFT